MLDSAGERKIHAVLSEHGVPFSEEYEFRDLCSTSGRRLRFDFAVFDSCGHLDFLIEFQGRQHYEPVGRFGGVRGFQRQRYNDSAKRAYCVKMGLPLVLVPYWDEGRISYDYIMEAVGRQKEVSWKRKPRARGKS